MYKITKPVLNDVDKRRANTIFAYMLSRNNYCTKEELCAVLDWPYNSSNDRRIREIISNLAKVRPIISTSDSRGYKLARSVDDLEEALHQHAELTKRAAEIKARCAPLVEFMEKLRA